MEIKFSELISKIKKLEPGDFIRFSTDPVNETWGITRMRIFDGDIFLLGYLSMQNTSIFNIVNQVEDNELSQWIDHYIDLDRMEPLYIIESNKSLPFQKTENENIVSSYFFYMWNTWSNKECETVFGWECKHFWDKWVGICEKLSTHSAAEKFYAELSTNNRVKIVNRACELYDGDKVRCDRE